MCTGAEAALLAASVASTAAGTAAKVSADKKADKAAARRIDAETERQRRLREEASGKALDTLNQFAPKNFDEKKTNLQDENLETVADLIDSKPVATSFTEKSAPTVVGKEFARQSAQASKEAGDFAKALANFSSGSQALGFGNLRRMTNQQLIDIIGRNQAISAGLLPGEVANAQRLAESPLGDALLKLGKTGLSTAISGGMSGGEIALTGARPTGTSGPLGPGGNFFLNP